MVKQPGRIAQVLLQILVQQIHGQILQETIKPLLPNCLNYIGLATVEGKGTTEFISNYTYFDPLPFNGNNYYRMKQTDYDGTYEVLNQSWSSMKKQGP